MITYLLHFLFFHKYFHWRKYLPLLWYLKSCPLPLTLILTLTQTLTLIGSQFVRGQFSGRPRFYINLMFFTFSLNQLLPMSELLQFMLKCFSTEKRVARNNGRIFSFKKWNVVFNFSINSYWKTFCEKLCSAKGFSSIKIF